MSHVVVLGAGIIGITTAYYLNKAGHQVTVVERNAQAGLETSYANGGQLSYSYVAPLAGPGVVPKIPPWLLRADSPLRFYPRFDFDQWRWCIAFLQACNRPQSEISTVHLLRLAYYSRKLIHDIVANEPVRFGYRRNGKLVIFSDQASFDGAKRTLDFQRAFGSEQAALDGNQCLDLEPALQHIRHRVVGGIHTASEEAGDCHDFCVAMEAVLKSRGVTFRTSETVQRFVVDTKDNQKQIRSVVTDKDEVAADAFVMAMGAANAWHAKTLGFYMPIYPLKGYSLTLDTSRADVTSAPHISVTDSAYKVVYALLGNELRIAGMADIAGFNTYLDPVRVNLLIKQAKAVFPDAGDYTADLKPWCGLRPATPKGTPILGASPIANLYLNAGHGALGWTLSCGCAKVVSDMISGQAPEIALEGLTLAH
ncbi:MAG: D-amino acid dehydrogenase [Betaproteobacteria bacterium]|nr:D-amino acid dehydrogenase [Betaproteobacteria bacterium]